jgi:beta-lactamase regulating signal transducer with metallopeptidase domain
MSSLFAMRALLFGGELFAGSALIVALVMIGTSMKAASVRHLAWTCVFGVLLALPFFATTLPSAFHIWLPAPPAPTAVEMASDAVFVPVTEPQAPSAFNFDFDTATIASMLGALWLTGALLVTLRFAIGGVCLALLKRKSRPFALAPGDEPNVGATAQECELRLCDGETGPIAWGIFRPVILLPNSAHQWTRERMQTVLLHELAHIRRRDSLTRALSQAACALYWPNPLVWMAAKELRHEAEIAADDAVIAWGIKPSTYAGELLKLAQEFRAREPAFSNMALFMAEPSALEARVESVLAPTQSRSGVTSMDVLKITGLGFVAATALALACPSLAQETAPPPANGANQTVSAETAANPAIESAPLAPPAPAAAPDAPPAPDAAPAAPPAPHIRAVHPAVAAAPVPPLPPVPATPAVRALPAAPALPALPAVEATPAQGADAGNSTTRIRIDGRDWNDMTPAERARVRAEIDKARRQAREMMSRAMAEAQKHRAEIERAATAIQAHRTEIDAAIASRRVELERAMAEVKAHRADMDAAMAVHRADLERTMAEAQAGLAAAAQTEANTAAQDDEHRRVEIERDGNDVRVREQVLHDARPAMEAAIAEAKNHRAEIEAAMAKVKPELDKALAKIKADMAKQHVDVRIEERLDEALRRAELRIEADGDHAHEHSTEHREDHRSEDRNTSVAPDTDKDDDK